jgi:DNA-binding CsgD family transcriptional regulator
VVRRDAATGSRQRHAFRDARGTERALPKGLTAREVEVLVHMARGRTNKEIAVALGISPRTAQHHIEHIYAKAGVSTRAAIVVPSWGAGARFPVLVALHGRGESLKPPSAGALGWPKDYALTRAIARACAPPLTDADYEGMSDPARLASTNRDLAARPRRRLARTWRRLAHTRRCHVHCRHGPAHTPSRSRRLAPMRLPMASAPMCARCSRQACGTTRCAGGASI